MSIINFLNKTEDFLNKQNETIKEQANILKNEYNLISADELSKTLSLLKNENRLLRVGIIGRVKAGKSSLLNSLLFDGESILPKAATPMTAALTIMEYSDDDKAKATIDFFTEKDLKAIKELTLKYESDKEKIRKEQIIHFQNLPRKLSSDEIIERAAKKTEREMKNHYAFASYDQYERMKNSGMNLSELQQYKNIEASSVDDLIKNKLYDFVGANGKYMPFTKSVKLYLPKESLKGLEIIDTPGINDPVASRGARTEELLKTCDVVLIVSPSGQFLSNEDMSLMSRVTMKEGIQETYIIASQADNQLFGNLKSDLPSETLQKITTTLNKHARNTLTSEANQYPEMRPILDKFLTEDIICNSSAAFSLWKNFEAQDKWDETASHLWKQLNQYYPNVFSNSIEAKKALLKLANIAPIEKVIEDVKSKKIEIVASKSKALMDAQYKTVLEFINGLDLYLTEQINRIKDTDLATTEEEKQKFIRIKDNLEYEIQNTYSELVDEIRLNLKSSMKKKVSNIFSQFDGDSARGTDTETRTESYDVLVKRGGLVRKTLSLFSFGIIDDGDEYETQYRDYTVTVNYVSPTQIKNQIYKILNRIEDQLEEEAQIYFNKWKKSFDNKFISIIQNICRQEDFIIDKKIVNSAILNVKNAIPEFSFKLNKTLPENLNYSERLKNEKGDEFLNNAQEYVTSLEESSRDRVSSYVTSIIDELKQIKAEDKLVNHIGKQIIQLANDLQNAEESINNYERVRKELKQIENKS